MSSVLLEIQPVGRAPRPDSVSHGGDPCQQFQGADVASVSKVIHTDHQLHPGQFGKAAYTGWIRYDASGVPFPNRMAIHTVCCRRSASLPASCLPSSSLCRVLRGYFWSPASDETACRHAVPAPRVRAGRGIWRRSPLPGLMTRGTAESRASGLIGWVPPINPDRLC
jgi:hypothetical protein